MVDTKNQKIVIEENEILRLLKKYGSYWPLFVVSLILSLLVVFLYLKYWSIPQYEVSSTILIKNQDSGKGTIDTENIKNLGLFKNTHIVEDEIGILTSTGIMEKVVSNKSLNVFYFVDDFIREQEIYGDQVPVEILVDESDSDMVFDNRIDYTPMGDGVFELRSTVEGVDYKVSYSYGELVEEPFGTFTINLKQGEEFEASTKPFSFVVYSTDGLVGYFLSNLSVELVNVSGNLLQIRLLCTDREKGEDVVAGLIETYVSEMIKHENELAENTIKMVDERLKLLSGEIEGVERSVEQFKSENYITDVSSNANLYIEQANDYKKMIADYQTEINVVNDIEEYLLNGNLNSEIPASLSTSDPSMLNMIDRYNESLLSKKQMLQSASSSNPLIVNLDRRLSDLRQAILENVKSTKNRLNIAQRNLRSNANRYEAQIAKVPSMERQLVDIGRDKSTKEGLYLYLLQKREEEVLSLAAPVSSTRVVSLPKAGNYPVAPNKKMHYLAGLLVGLFIPVVLIYGRDSLNNKIHSTEDISNTIAVPVIGEIAKKEGDSPILDFDQSQSPLVELFRLLHFNLDYLKKTSKNQTLLVTSTVKGEGKTFIASNLAVALASNGEKVVALTFDLREPQLMENFGMKDSPGIIDFILNKDMEPEQIVQADNGIENLALIGPGNLVQYVGRLVLSDRIRTLMEYLKKSYDRIIIDTPPVGLISDAFALNEYIDSTVYVMRKGVTKKEYLKTAQDIAVNEKLKNTLVVLNGTEAPEAYGYYNKQN